MFDEKYRFYGTHAQKVMRLTGFIDKGSNACLFKRNVDIYVNAPLIGFLFGRRAEMDRTKNPDTNDNYVQNIMLEQVLNLQDELLLNFRMIMLLDKDYEPDEERRIDKAFRHMGEDPADEERFNSYVRGGIDVLYEKLMEDATTAEEHINNLFCFIDDFQKDFNEGITGDMILEKCSK